jgi:thiamine biosynthesis lipoprotein
MNEKAESLRLERTADVMKSAFSIILYGADPDRMQMAVDKAFAEARRIDELLSIYRPESEWSRINRYAAEREVAISAESFQLLSRCLDYSRLSAGAFDISVGPLIKAWGFFRGTGRLPDAAEVAAALAKVGYRHIHLNHGARSVRFDCSGMEICPGGIGKGYAVDRVVGILRQEGFNTALVLSSRSSIYGIGTPPTEPKGWCVDILHPGNARRSVSQVFLKNMSLSTSGGSEQIFWEQERFYSHLIDPRTGCSAPGMLSASVLAPCTMDSEAWAKPCLINGRAWARDNLPECLNAFFHGDGPQPAERWLRDF